MNCSQKFYTEFKPIRNKLSSFRKDDVIIICFNNLKNIWNLNPIEILQKKLPLPWHLFLILKWGFVYCANKYEGKHFTQNDFANIYKNLKELPSNYKWIESKDSLDLWKWIRANFTGQFTYQINSGIYGLAAMDIMINDIKIDYDIATRIKNIVGVDTEDFLNFQFLINGLFINDDSQKKYSLEFFNTFKQESDLKNIEIFLKYISLDFYGVEAFLTDHHKILANPEFEYNLLSPLWKKPLYRFNNNYVAYHKSLINNFTEFGLYDILKTSDSEGFSSSFGYCFEEFITIPLQIYTNNYRREKQIKKEFNVTNAVDFLLKEEKQTLLIEAKSAEMYELTPLNPEMKYLEQTFRNSLIKAYKQIFQNTYELKKRNPSNFKSDNFWAIIVTYKDFMFGSPELIWLEFMQTKIMEELPAEIISDSQIDPFKIFTLSLYEFELLMHYAKSKKISVIDLLNHAYSNNLVRETKKFSFIMHLADNNLTLKDFKHIKNKIDEIGERIKKYIV